MRMLTTADLREKGIPWTRQHINRKVKRGEFPPPVKIGASTNGWPETEIDAWLRDRLEERDRKRPRPNDPAQPSVQESHP
jgi:prophage regulatory protein